MSFVLRRLLSICTAALAVTIISAGWAAHAQDAAPDLVLFNGKIFTSDAAHPYVQALAVRGERILATGDSAKIKSLAGPKTHTIDLGGRTVIPGINDAHNHIGLDPPGAVHLDLGSPDPTWPQAQAAIAVAAAKAPKGTFIFGEIGLKIFHDTSVERTALDRVDRDHPIILTTLTGHAMLMNSAALARLGITEDVKDPVGGRFEREANGKLTGVVREYAALRVNRQLGALPDDAESLSQLRQFFEQALRYGITSTQDMSDAIEPARAAKLFAAAPTPIRIRIMVMAGTTPAGRDTREGFGLPRHPSALVTIDGTKWLLDGVPLENTLTPRRTPSLPAGEKPDYAVRNLPLTFSEKDMEAMLRESLANRSPVMVHVSGYLSAKAMLDAMDATGGKSAWRGKRVRFEHGDGLFPDLIPRAKELGVMVVQNPTHFDPRLLAGPGAPPFEKSQPLRSLIAAGIPVALGSDGPMNPYLNIMLACADPGRPSEAITREQAVMAYTRTSAYAEFAETEKGTLEPNKLADLAVLSQDIFGVPLPELPKTESLLTLVGGQVVYDAHVVDK
jgi:hypothetical protein